MFVVRDLLKEGTLIHICDPQVSREDMWIEMGYTFGINRQNTPKNEESIVTSLDIFRVIARNVVIQSHYWKPKYRCYCYSKYRFSLRGLIWNRRNVD